MAIQATINNITGQTPFDIYVCQPNGDFCFYINTITNSELPYVFDIPEPYNLGSSYMLKAIDFNNCIITGVTSVI
jgi:hypothetical protein